jgi:hypothetical protein
VGGAPAGARGRGRADGSVVVVAERFPNAELCGVRGGRGAARGDSCPGPHARDRGSGLHAGPRCVRRGRTPHRSTGVRRGPCLASGHHCRQASGGDRSADRDRARSLPAPRRERGPPRVRIPVQHARSSRAGRGAAPRVEPGPRGHAARRVRMERPLAGAARFRQPRSNDDGDRGARRASFQSPRADAAARPGSRPWVRLLARRSRLPRPDGAVPGRRGHRLPGVARACRTLPGRSRHGRGSACAGDHERRPVVREGRVLLRPSPARALSGSDRGDCAALGSARRLLGVDAPVL